jgi:hydrogenase/urease accessory protein HupE
MVFMHLKYAGIRSGSTNLPRSPLSREGEGRPWFHCMRIFLILAAMALLPAVSAFAHYLPMGASRWCFGENHIIGEIDLRTVVFSEIKGIREGGYNLHEISGSLLQQIARDVIQPYLDARLSITVEGKNYPVRVIKISQKGDNLLTIYVAADKVDFHNTENQVKISYSLLFEETKNDHINLAYGYLSNARGEELEVVFNNSPPVMQTTFDSNNQVWDFSVKGPGKMAAAGDETGMPAEESVLTTVREFIPLGIEHILTGYDHIAFLLALIVIGLSLKEALKIITAFTVAHSITLLMAAMQILSLGSRFVESVIALSICYVAVENILKKKVHYRWLIAFGFGLIHGFGFASALQELIVGQANLLISVLSFNAGVEIGQLTIVCTLLPLLYLLKKKFELRMITMGASASIFVFGFTWLIERVFDLKLLWF